MPASGPLSRCALPRSGAGEAAPPLFGRLRRAYAGCVLLSRAHMPAYGRSLRLGAERPPPLQVALWVDQVAVALDVAVLATDDEHDEVVVPGVGEPAGSR